MVGGATVVGRRDRTRVVQHEWTVRTAERLSEYDARDRCARCPAVCWSTAEDYPAEDGHVLHVILAGRPGPALRALCAELREWFAGAGGVVAGRSRR